MIKRKLNISTLLDKKQSILLIGPRGTGKTTIIRDCLSQIDKKVLHYDLLKGDVFRYFLSDPSRFRTVLESELKANPIVFAFVDEIQKIPALLDEIHYLLEEYPGKFVFVGSGSSARKLKAAGANLLAGRAILRKIFPLTYDETHIDLENALQFGTLPKVRTLEDDELSVEFLKSYVDVYLREEIQQEALVRKFDTFSRFLDLAGQLNAEPINFSKTAKQLKLSTKTVQGYFEILTDTLLVNVIHGWSESVKKQLQSSPRFYFFDVGVLNAINGELDFETKPESFRYGKLFETYIINEIQRAAYYRGKDLRFHYWRTNHGKEVDLIISNSKRQPLFAIEIKSASDVLEEDLAGLRLFHEEYPKAKLICICKTPVTSTKGNIHILPWREALDDLFSRFHANYISA